MKILLATAITLSPLLLKTAPSLAQNAPLAPSLLSEDRSADALPAPDAELFLSPQPLEPPAADLAPGQVRILAPAASSTRRRVNLVVQSRAMKRSKFVSMVSHSPPISPPRARSMRTALPRRFGTTCNWLPVRMRSPSVRAMARL
ncbi:MAG: hypothetical protein HC838_05435 [Spirulinaceae cyanobacterium RM2_2_10]|nr:hypothetical protein [Spirulinaceae cyanobacterium RM2_2_10]